MSKEKERQTLRIFVCHSVEDKEDAKQLIKHLLVSFSNVHIFTADGLSAGQNWQSIVKREISRSDVFVVLLSPTSLASSLVLSELGAAWGLGKPIIPVITEPGIISRLPMTLSNSQVLNLEDIKNPGTINQLIERYLLAA